jgi:hypothetical protein
MSDWNRHQDPEPKQDMRARAIAILVLAAAVVLGMILLATGTIEVAGG